MIPIIFRVNLLGVSRDESREDVVPLNSGPYIDIGQASGSTSLPRESTVAVETVSQPSMIFFLSSCPQQEWKMLSAEAQFGISLSGSAATGSIGPVLRLMALGKTGDSYYFVSIYPWFHATKMILVVKSNQMER